MLLFLSRRTGVPSSYTIMNGALDPLLMCIGLDVVISTLLWYWKSVLHPTGHLDTMNSASAALLRSFCTHICSNIYLSFLNQQHGTSGRHINCVRPHPGIPLSLGLLVARPVALSMVRVFLDGRRAENNYHPRQVALCGGLLGPPMFISSQNTC